MAKKKVYKVILYAEGRTYWYQKSIDLALYTKKPRIFQQQAHSLISFCGAYLKKVFPGIEKEQPKQKEYKRVEVTMRFLD